MPPNQHKKQIFIAISILVIIVGGVLYYNKLIVPPPLPSLSFKTTSTGENSTKQVAAVLLALPSTGNFNIGDTISVSLVVNTVNQSINAVAGTITFPTDKLEMASTSKDNSIISLWVQEPSLSATGDSITFSGALPSPGFVGPAGQIMNILFKVKSGGTATIDIKDAQVLANDGLGTNILTDVVPANLILVPPPTPQKNTADLNGDGKVDFSDVSILIAHWGVSKDPRFDLNKDGVVDIKDLSILISRIVQLRK
jgi:hypothetical protein